MADVSFAGLSTGIDTASLIKALVDAKRQPIVQLQQQADGFQSRLTQLGDLAGKLGALRTAVTALAYTNTFAAYIAASSDKDIVTAAASSAATEGNHTLGITQLAKAQTTLSDQTYTTSSSSLGIEGTLTLTPTGGSGIAVSLAATDTLEGVRDKINSSVAKGFGTISFNSVPVTGTTLSVDGVTYEFTTGAPSGSNIAVDPGATAASAATALAAAATGAGKGANTTMTANGASVRVAADAAGTAGNAVTMTKTGDTGGGISLSGANLSGGGTPPYAASILNAGTAASPSYRLLITARNSGTANGFAASFSGAGILSFTDSQGAQDAVISVDGISGITRSSNVIGDVLSGVTFSLGKDTSVSGPVSITVSKDTTSVKDKIGKLVSAYNDLRSYIVTNTKFDPKTKTGGPLMGESSVETISRGLSSLVIRSVTGLTGTYTALSRIGITSDKSDGSLSIDSAKLDAAMTADFQGVSRLFGRDLSSGVNGVAYQIQSKIDGWMSSVDGVITIRKGGIQQNIDRINSQIDQKESAAALYEASLKLQFARLEQLVSSMKDQSGALNSLNTRLS